MDLSVNIGKLQLRNPVITASGTFGYGEEYAEFLDIKELGAVVVKGLSLLPREGNPPPRIVETPAGMLNSIGLQNIGIEEFITEKLPYLKKLKVPVIVNFFGDSIEEYVEAAERLGSVEGISGLEMNISCPNKEAGWSVFGVKLSPNVTDIALMAKTAEGAGADAVSLINTLTGMAIDIRSKRPKLANITGGLSGPAVRPVAVRMVWECYKNISIPVIGMGGILSANDALEFILAGASAVAVGTGNFTNPRTTIEVLEGIRSFMSEEGLKSLKELTGKTLVRRTRLLL
jgi:dihydroorotate dehydrogenase (NAD+) catalytic subunit